MTAVVPDAIEAATAMRWGAPVAGEATIAEELLTQILDITTEPSPVRADALIETARRAASDPHVAPEHLAERMSAAGKACVAAGAHDELISGAVLLGVSSRAERRRGSLRQAAVLARAGLDRVRSADGMAGQPPLASWRI